MLSRNFRKLCHGVGRSEQLECSLGRKQLWLAENGREVYEKIDLGPVALDVTRQSSSGRHVVKVFGVYRVSK